MEEYIKFEEEKAQRRGQTFNWQTATFGKVENYEDEDVCSIDFETEYPTIVFNNATFPSEPTVYSLEENKIDFRISLDESDDEDYTIGDYALIPIRHMAPLPAADQKHPWLRYKVEGYTQSIVHSYEQRLETIWSRPVNWVHVLDFVSLTPEMRHDLAVRMRMVCSGEGQQVMSDTVMDLDTADTLCFQLGGDRLIPNKGDLRDCWMEISSDRDLLGPAPSYVLIRDLVRRLYHKMIAYNISGRGQAPEKVTGVDLFYVRSMDHRTINIPHLLA
ncbi:hypothetical protein Tco_0502810 [Tanacetum coccineum]